MDITLKLPEWAALAAILTAAVGFLTRLYYSRRLESLRLKREELQANVQELEQEVIDWKNKEGNATGEVASLLL